MCTCDLVIHLYTETVAMLHTATGSLTFTEYVEVLFLDDGALTYES